MKTLKRLKITLVIPILIFMSIMFMATHCADYNPDMLFKLIGDVPEKVYNCVEDTCEITIEFETDRPLDTLLIKFGEEQGFEQIDFEEGEEGTYQVSITLERGINNITLKGESYLSFSELSFTIECVCPEEGAPEITWDPDKPPTDTTTEGTAKLNITSDKELDTLKVTTNGQEQVIQNPQAEQDGEMYNYETTVELQDGDNEIEVQGENAVGPSNLLQHNIEKGEPPVIDFAEQPQDPVTNCVQDECEVTITISCENGCNEITTQVGEGDPYSMSDFQTDVNGNVPIPVTLQKGTNVITITAKNRFGTSNTLTCTIECVCEESSSPTIHLDPDLPPTTTFDTIEIKITADQVMEAFKMWNNGLGPDVIESPVYDEETDEGYLYSVDRSISEGGNELSFVGINENGESNQEEHSIERGRVPWIEFDPEPPTEVSNCENDECTYILKIYDYAGSINDAWKMTNLFHQVGSGGDLIENSVEPDAENKYSIPVTLQKGRNVITITAFNRFGSDSLTCTIECVCEETPSGYTKEKLIGETDIPKPIGMDFYPDYQQQKNFLNVLTKKAEDETQIMHGELTGGAFGNKYPHATLPPDAIGYAFDGNNKTNFLLLPDQVKKLESDGQTLTGIHTFPGGQTGQPGQLDFDNGPGKTSFITKDSNGHSTLNIDAQQFPLGQGCVGLGNMHQASYNQALNGKTAMCVFNLSLPSGSRDSGQDVFTLDPETGVTSTLFEVPLSHGNVIDILPDIFNDYETVQFIILTVKNETEYWVNIYNQAGERLDAFKTHDLSDLAETSGDTIFYKVIKATDWPDGKLYIIHSEFPGIQVWAPVE